MDGIGGLKGWQWMFILEGAPAVILSFVVLYYLTDRPAEANWLEPDERKWLSDKLEEEQRQRVAAAHFTVGEALTNPRVLALAAVYFGAVATNYGISFWLPQIIKDFGNLSNLQIGVITAIPGGFFGLMFGSSFKATPEVASSSLIASDALGWITLSVWLVVGARLF